MNKIVVFALLSVCAASAEIKVDEQSTHATSKEIVFTYAAPETYGSSDACSIKASRANNFGLSYVPADDVDTTKFSGSDLDTRNAGVIEGRTRTFVLGKDVAERGADGYVYSRALKAATTYYIQITCGAHTATFSAATKTVPFGLTRGESLPADPAHPGEYLHPSRKWDVAGQKIIDPEYGTELSFPEAAGSRGAARATATFKEATGAKWSNAGAALRDGDGAAATISGDNTATLFLRWDQDAYPLGDATFKSYDALGLDYLKLIVKGSGAAATPDDRTLQAAITFDSIHPASPWQEVVLPPSEGTVTVGSGKPGDTWENRGDHPFSRMRMVKKAGQFTYTAATHAVTLVKGTTSADWTAGTNFRVFQPAVQIIDVQAGSPPTVTTDSDHGLSTGNTVVLKGVTGTIANSVNGTWKITVTGPRTFTLDNVTATGAYSSPMAVCYGGGQTKSGTPPIIYVPNSFLMTGTKLKLDRFTSAGWTDLNGNIYSITQYNGSSEIFSVNGAAATGNYDQTNLDSPNCYSGNAYAVAYKIMGSVQKYDDYPIRSVDGPTAITLDSGPGNDISTPADWSVDAFGVLLRKKTASADPISVQYAAMDYETSAGTAWGAAGGSICSAAEVVGPDGKNGNLCYLGALNVFLSTDGTTLSPWGHVRSYEELVSYSQGNECVGNDSGANQGTAGVNPKQPNRVYCMPISSSDRSLIVADYVGDYRALDPSKGPGSLYKNYAGYPVIPNCNGYSGIEGANSAVSLPAGTPCVKYHVLATSLKSLIRNYGEQKWTQLNKNLESVMCAPDVNSLGYVYNADAGKVQFSIKCSGGQDHPGVVYVFEIDDDQLSVAPIGEVATWDRDGTRWSGIHGGVGPTDVAYGYVRWTPHPMNVDPSNYVNIGLSDQGWLRGPYWFPYTSVNGVADTDMTVTGPAGLQSCAQWADSPYLPSPTPTGSSVVDGFVAGCTTITIASEPCDDSLGPVEREIINQNADLHQAKCGRPGARWLQDVKVGDILLHYDPKDNDWRHNEYSVVIHKTGSGPGATLVLYRGGDIHQLGNDGPRGAKEHTGQGRKLVAWMQFNVKNGLYPSYYVNYGAHPFGTEGAEEMQYAPGHGQETKSATLGNSDGGYGVTTGDLETRKNKTGPDYIISNITKFNGRNSNDILSVDSHITYVPQAHQSQKYDFLLDGRPWNGYDGVSGARVDGTTSVYKWSKIVWNASMYTKLFPKHLPVAARAGTKVLRSISGPQSVIDDSKPYTYCYALIAGECRPDSVAGDFYMTAPGITSTGGVRQCCGQDRYDASDLAFTSATNIVSRYTQTLMLPITTGGATRALTSGFDQYRVEDTYKNWSIVTTGTQGVGRTRGLENVKSELWTLEMPPVAVDSWDRTGYIKYPVRLGRYPMADNVVVEFGYARYGNPAAGQYYCMDRLDNCMASARPTDNDPFTFASEGAPGIPCSSGCTVNLPVVGNRVLYYHVQYRSGSRTLYTTVERVLVTP